MRLFCLVLSLVFLPTSVVAVSVPHNFQPNTPALSSEVNANFDALVQAVNAMEARIQQLETDLATAESNLAAAEAEIVALKANSVLALDGFLFLDVDARGNDVARFDQVNVQITNGLGATNGNPAASLPWDGGTVNGLGNLIVGYNEEDPVPFAICSDGAYDNQVDCEANGELWAPSQKSGSHNLVIGPAHSYTDHGGLIAGAQNVVNRRWASVGAGRQNEAAGEFSSVSGGRNNRASGAGSSVSGGSQNEATASESSVSAGLGNVASGNFSSVSGGSGNDATGVGSSVSGGISNAASGIRSSVSGGFRNVAGGTRSSISGGIDNITSAFYASVSGGDSNIASGEASSVSGGLSGIAAGQYDWRAGTLFEND